MSWISKAFKKVFGSLGPLGGGALGLLAAPFTFGTSLAAIPGASVAAQAAMAAGGYTAGKKSVQGLQEESEREAKAAADAAAKQAEFEASQKEGLESLARRRRRGFGSSMIAQPSSSLGSSSRLGS